jgi:hypothetical protein
MADQQAFKKKCVQLWRSGTKPRTIRSAGLSMHPLIPDGSMLTFIPFEADRPIISGDIVLFERGEKLTAHRVLGSFYDNGSLWYREKGDNKFLPGAFPAECLVGRIIKIEYDGHVSDLNGLQTRFAAHMIGLYWNVLFAFLRGAISCKRLLFSTSRTPRLRSFILKTVRIFSRLPTLFIK